MGKETNHNVALTNYFTLLDGLAMGMWNYAVLGPYLYKLCGDNKHAGYAEGIQGTAQAIAAIPAGILADRSRRDTVLRWSGVIGLVSVALTILGLCQPFPTWQQNYIVLTVGLAVFGVYWGAWSPPLFAIYADSVPAGSRSKYETLRYVISIAALASGPVTNVALFYFLGDDWGMRQMTIIFIVGIALHVVSIGALFFFNDDKTLGAEAQGLLEGNANRQDGSTTATQSNAEDEEEALVALRYEEAEKTKAKCFSFLRVWMVPYIVCLSDVLFGLASGMTIKFFPIYFAEVLKLPPTTVNIVFVLDPVTEVLFSLTAQKLSLTFGRVEVALVFKLVGVSLLAVMAYFPDAWIAQPYWLCAIYIIRSALINCVVPLNRSILMDYASVKSRGKWNSIDSVAAFGWSGSAVVGGLLVDNYGFEMSFVCTALIQFIAWCPLILLLPLVTREERIEAKRRASSIGDRAPLAFPEPIMGHQEYQQ